MARLIVIHGIFINSTLCYCEEFCFSTHDDCCNLRMTLGGLNLSVVQIPIQRYVLAETFFRPGEKKSECIRTLPFDVPLDIGRSFIKTGMQFDFVVNINHRSGRGRRRAGGKLASRIRVVGIDSFYPSVFALFWCPMCTRARKRIRGTGTESVALLLRSRCRPRN